MKLRKIKIRDFRQFYGIQEISLATDDFHNVTLIHGENNGGKTALLNALRWCLYEKTTANLLNPNELMNKHALRNGETSFSVSVELVHNNKLYEIRRRQASSRGSKSVVRIYEVVEDGCYSERPENHPMTLINSFLPEEMAEYFFYQGEGTGTLNSQNDFSHINAAICKVLGLTIAEKTTEHLDRIRTDYQKELIQFDTSNKLPKVVEQKHSLEDDLKTKEIVLKNQKEKLVMSHKAYEQQITKLAKFDKSHIEKDIKLRNEKERIISDLKRRKKSLLITKQKSLANWIKIAFSSKLAKIDLNGINTEELNRKMRYSVDKNLIAEILDKTECLCGAHLDEGSNARILINELSKFAVDPDLRRRWQKTNKLASKLNGLSSPKSEMLELFSELDDNDERTQELIAEVNELSHLIKNSDLEDIKEIEREKERLHQEYQDLERSIPKLEEQIKRNKIDINSLENDIRRLSSSLPQANKLNEIIKATEKILAIYKDAITESKKNVDTVLLTIMQDFFAKVAFNGYTVKKQAVQTSKSFQSSSSFTWVIVDQNDKKVAAGNGYQAMLAISFIVALIKFSKERSNSQNHLLTPGTVAPFIADSILAFISPDNGRELVRYIAESVEQSIFMFSQAQWTEKNTDLGIRSRVGKEYNLVQHTTLSQEEFKGTMPTKLVVQGKEYDVVRFDAQFDHVTIEEVLVND